MNVHSRASFIEKFQLLQKILDQIETLNKMRQVIEDDINTIKIRHNAGFFSCCSVKLANIIQYINTIKRLPLVVDSSNQFNWYKIDKEGDITYDYFEHYNKLENINIELNINIDYNWDYQFIDYSNLNYHNICPIIKKYFTPSNDIMNIIKNIEEKYNIDYNNLCVLFYRGNDKNTETKICGYNEYIKYADLILSKNLNTKFLIQSDETEFIEYFTDKYSDKSFYFKDEIRHIKKCNSSVDIIMKNQNYIYSKNYLAITIIMSKCKYIVCGSGNCSMWIMYYRGNNNNVFQNLNNKWIINSNV